MQSDSQSVRGPRRRSLCLFPCRHGTQCQCRVRGHTLGMDRSSATLVSPSYQPCQSQLSDQIASSLLAVFEFVADSVGLSVHKPHRVRSCHRQGICAPTVHRVLKVNDRLQVTGYGSCTVSNSSSEKITTTHKCISLRPWCQ